MGDWTTIESDPGVFTELIGQFGVRGVQVEELWGLEQQEFERLGSTTHGLIFLFKWQSSSSSGSAATESAAGTSRQPLGPQETPATLFFAKQVITNACATQALLGVLLNADSTALDLGSTLTEFREFTQDMTPDLKGLAISNSDPIRSAHNSFARNEPFVMESVKAKDDDDVFHFIAYVPHAGRVYEIDGLQEGPIDLGEVPEVSEGSSSVPSWVDIVKPAIEERMARYSSSEIRFNLLALIRNRKEAFEEELQQLISASAEGMEGDEAREGELRALIAEEEAKIRSQREENVRRRHNFVPMAVTFLRILAEKGLLSGMVERAEERREERRAQKQKDREAKGGSNDNDNDNDNDDIVVEDADGIDDDDV